MLQFDFESLSGLGLTSALAGRALALEVEATIAWRLVRITEVHRETLAIHDGREERSARALPWLVRALAESDTALAAGDWALARVDTHGQCWLEHRVPPSSHIVRRDGDGRRHPIVSNVDIALLVMGLDDDFNPRRLERFLALVPGEIVPVVVLTKADLVAQDVLDSRLGVVRSRIPAQVPIVAVDATAAEAAQALDDYCTRGSTLVMLGSSGTGKSTLTNTLLGTAVQDTGPVREHDSRGKHTTTSRSLHRLPGGACVIDTPGLRTLRVDGDPTALAGSFADIEALALHCKFGDCQHAEEPGCAVRASVDADRLRNYRKLLRELRRDTLTVFDRQQQRAVWRVRGRAVKAQMRLKRGLG